MDNITHSLVGITLADAASGKRNGKADRRLMVGAGVIAANLPDLDLIYTGVIPPPLGYLLHHRGHTHTVMGVAVLAALLLLAYRVLPPVKRMPLADRLRLWGVIAAGLASHVALDSLNSYGVHPFYPGNPAWYFGDAVFIFEPLLWTVFGIAAAWNTHGKLARIASTLPVVIFPLLLAWMRIVPIEALVILTIVSAAFAKAASRLSPRARAAAALIIVTAAVSGWTSVARVARAASAQVLEPHVRGRLVDLVLSPNPASPLCWSVIGIELNEAAGEYVLWRGTLSLAPRWKPPESCASYRFAGVKTTRMPGDGSFALRDETHHSLSRLRSLAEGDCWVRAWLRFGRVPVITGNEIYDLRFAERPGQDFTRMRIQQRSDCPRFVPGWAMPRADLLRR